MFDVRLGGGAERVELPDDVRPQPGARHGLLAAEGALVVVAGVAHSLDGRAFICLNQFIHFELQISNLEVLVAALGYSCGDSSDPKIVEENPIEA